MTESEWLTTLRLRPLLDRARPQASVRQHLLLAVAFCRRIWDRFPFDDCRELVEAVERLADQPRVDGDDYAVAAEVDAGFSRLQEGYPRVHEAGEQVRGAYLAALACGGIWHDPDGTLEAVTDAVTLAVTQYDRGPWEYGRRRGQEWQVQADLLRDIFGNPFRPVAVAPAWRSETAVSLASGIYAERAFDHLPILADALEEAGCDHADILAHCRGPGPHARGCWVVDLVLQKG